MVTQTQEGIILYKSKGFTLIELILVIVLIGILAIVAAPKALRLSSDARIATLEGMQGAMQSGAQLIYSRALIEEKTDGSDSITVNGATIELHSGYPVGNWQAGIRYIVDLDDIPFSNTGVECTTEWCGRGNQTSLASGVSTTSPGRLGKIWPEGFTWADQCGVYYINHENGLPPEFGIESEDC